ncbi:MerR family transcriptional regulator [Companilactobacillus nantensis]|uniref:MerR family transcriptional regulator n=1 Tax=Companilactobacillus nantensis DSM 16982 TaxID=1423774 RepID=A0A0R1WCH2_9LACO|nr:MerR family transcriptional regulator [Companilactobacillus nantensis]KRM15221.1 MerR family transcriptional regulator [Companilactobacillus nantensis DSM 16982]GEO65275.1 MerR family transcriptional regulator [Companilactobacillus nantensis]
MEKTYSIKEVADYFKLPISTIRYYDKKGLLPFVSKNEAGYRVFSESDFGFIKTICCLKNTGMPIKDIQTYIELCMQGTRTIDQRKEMLQQHKQNVVQKQQLLAESLQEINTKIERYDSKDSQTIISAQIKFVKDEKRDLHLKDPFI